MADEARIAALVDAYHSEDACGPRLPDIPLDRMYETRFKCFPGESTAEKRAKLEKALRCFSLRVDTMHAHKQGRTHSNAIALEANVNHRYPIELAYAYATDCARKIQGHENISKPLQNYAQSDFLKDRLKHTHIPYNHMNYTDCSSTCPDLFNWCEKGIRSAQRLRPAEFEEELARIPFMEEGDRLHFVRCMERKREEVAAAITHYPTHQNLRPIEEQIKLILEYARKTNNNGRELHTRNRRHQINYAHLKSNIASGNVNRIRNTRRANRPYYKRLRTTISKRMNNNAVKAAERLSAAASASSTKIE